MKQLGIYCGGGKQGTLVKVTFHNINTSILYPQGIYMNDYDLYHIHIIEHRNKTI